MIDKYFLLEGLTCIAPIMICFYRSKTYQHSYILRQNQRLNNSIQKLNMEQIIGQCLKKIQAHKNQINDLIQIPNCTQVLEPYHYVRNIGGKKIRICMAIIINEMFHKEVSSIVFKIGALIEFLHTASLIIDDIEDGSILRRQQKCSHLVYGLDRSINAANLVYFQPFRKLLQNFQQENQKGRIIQIFFEEMVTSHLGQAQDVQVHKLTSKESLPSLQQYYRLISAKTSSLLRMMVKMIGVAVGISQQNLAIFRNVMNFVGISFQITDDILNLSRGMGKGVIAQDLHEKKFTIIVHFMRDHQRFMESFIHPNKSDQSIKQMLEYIQQEGVIPKCKEIAQQFSDKALNEVEKINCPYDKSKFQKLIRFIVSRDR